MEFAPDIISEEGMSITWSGEAGENFAAEVERLKGWTVRLTPLDGGEPITCEFVGSAQAETDEYGNGWYDAVYFRRSVDPANLIPLADEGKVATEHIRVRDIFVF